MAIVTQNKNSIASMKYDKTHTQDIRLKLNKKTDKELLSKLKSVGNVQGYIKSLIKADLKKSNTTAKKQKR